MTAAYIALGGNIGNPRQQVLDAVDALARLPLTRLLRRSRLYRTPPWGVLAQPPFVNAAALLETGLELFTQHQHHAEHVAEMLH